MNVVVSLWIFTSELFLECPVSPERHAAARGRATVPRPPHTAALGVAGERHQILTDVSVTGIEGRAELTEVSGTGIEIVPNLPKCRVPGSSSYRALPEFFVGCCGRTEHSGSVRPILWYIPH